jgi:hypothetical protein
VQSGESQPTIRNNMLPISSGWMSKPSRLSATGFMLVPVFFLICTVGGGINVHSTLRPLNGLLCQPLVIMIMEKSVE